MAWTPISGIKTYQAEGLRSSPAFSGVAQKSSSMIWWELGEQRLPLLFDGARLGPTGSFPIPIGCGPQRQSGNDTHLPSVSLYSTTGKL
jgi:hypothetical protein